MVVKGHLAPPGVHGNTRDHQHMIAGRCVCGGDIYAGRFKTISQLLQHVYSSLDALFTLHRMGDAARHRDRELRVVYVGCWEAFDAVRRDLLLPHCKQLGIYGPPFWMHV